MYAYILVRRERERERQYPYLERQEEIQGMLIE